MNRCLSLYLWILLLFTVPAQAQLYRASADAGKVLVRTCREELLNLPEVEESIAKQIYAVSRYKLRGESNLLTIVPRGLVQVKLPEDPFVLGTGFLFEKDNHLFVGMAYHIGGRVGNQRTVQVFSRSGQPQEYLVTINARGPAGWHSADISIAELPLEALVHGAQPLKVGKPKVAAPVFSLGYTGGNFEQHDFLPVRGELLSAEGYNLEGSRELIHEEKAAEPFLFSGYCGSPLVQLQENSWKVVGVYVGGCVEPGEQAGNKTFAVNLSQTIPQLVDTYLNAVPLFNRGLYFRGWPVGRLEWTELLNSVQVWRGEMKVFEQNLQRYPGPYSDEHSELALQDFDLQSGDIIRYMIRVNRNKTRSVDFMVP